MRTKSTVLVSIALAAIAMQGVFTSCSSDESVNTEKSTGLQTLKVNLSPISRAAVYTDPGTTNENTINSVTIGIFSTTGVLKTIQDASVTTTTTTSANITTSQLTAGDKILVAVNAKAGTFAGATSETDFENKALAIDDALAGGSSSATTVANTKLPMFGTGTIALSSGSTTAFESSVDIYHMVSKVTLQSLNVNFATTGAYNKATFTPTEVFLSNVPDQLDFYPANTISSYSTFATYTNLCHGESTVTTNLKSYLGTGTPITGFTPVNNTLSGLSTGTTSNWGASGSKILYLYTMPSNNTGTLTASRLVIKGVFRSDGTDATKTTVYYPVNINYNSADGKAVDGGTAKQIYPNKNYILSVTISSKGSDSATTPIDPEAATATVTVKSFVDASQTNIFN
jgi:hypothetical protein